MIWFTLALFAVSFLVTVLLAPKPQIENARASGLDDLRFPQSSEGAPIGLALGKVRVRAPNTLWYGDFTAVPITEKVKTGLFSSKRVTVGYQYYVGFHLALALGPNAVLRRIWIDKDEVWSGTAGPGETAISINQPNLFGGHKEGGGFVGTLRYYGGDFSQPANAYVTSRVGDVYPRYGGLAHIVFEKPYIGEAAQLRPMSFEIEVYTNGLGLSSALQKVGEDLNPAEALYQILTSDWGGLGVDPNELDRASFIAAAQTLADEGNGISLLITRANSGKQVIEEVLRQIDGIMYQDPTTGRIVLELIRYDYDPLDLPVFDETNIVAVRNFSRTSWEDTLNQVRVTYQNRANKYETGSAIAQDMANIAAQGRLRSTNVSFPGCSNGTLAVQLATRELSRLSVPLYKATLEVNRKGAQMRPGDPFVFSWPDYGIERMVMRVQRFNLGELVDGRVVIDALQDEFATNLTVFAPPEDSSWEPVDSSGVTPTQVAFIEVPYFIMQNQDLATVPPTAAGKTYLMVMCRRPASNQLTYSATITQSSEEALAVDKSVFTDTAILSTAILATDGGATGEIASITVEQVSPDMHLEAATTAEQQRGKNLFLINGELFTFASVTNNGNGTYTLGSVKRSLLDTTFEAHAAGDVLYFLTLDALSAAEWDSSVLATASVTSATHKDTSAAAYFNLVPDRRYERPLPPAYPTINGSRAPATITTTGPHTIKWYNRARDSGVIRAFNDTTDDTLEAGQTITLRLYLNDVLQGGHTQTGLTGTSTTINLVSGWNGTVRVELVSVISGLESRVHSFVEFPVNVP